MCVSVGACVFVGSGSIMAVYYSDIWTGQRVLFLPPAAPLPLSPSSSLSLSLSLSIPDRFHVVLWAISPS